MESFYAHAQAQVRRKLKYMPHTGCLTIVVSLKLFQWNVFDKLYEKFQPDFLAFGYTLKGLLN